MHKYIWCDGLWKPHFVEELSYSKKENETKERLMSHKSQNKGRAIILYELHTYTHKTMYLYHHTHHLPLSRTHHHQLFTHITNRMFWLPI